MLNKNTKKAILIGIGTAAAYNFVIGKGIFNKPRFYHQHKAVKKYLSSSYPEAVTGDIFKTFDGWSCIVNDNGVSFVLNITKTFDGDYIFSRSEL